MIQYYLIWLCLVSGVPCCYYFWISFQWGRRFKDFIRFRQNSQDFVKIYQDFVRILEFEFVKKLRFRTIIPMISSEFTGFRQNSPDFVRILRISQEFSRFRQNSPDFFRISARPPPPKINLLPRFRWRHTLHKTQPYNIVLYCIDLYKNNNK